MSDASTPTAAAPLRPEQLEALLGEHAPAVDGAELGAVAEALGGLIKTARATYPADWVDDLDLARHALHHVAEGDGLVATRIRSLRAADLRLALACGRGVEGAMRCFDDEHLANVASFVARIDASPSFADEVRQRLRSRLLVGTPAEPARILAYSGTGPIGGWLRVCAIREARAMSTDRRRQRDLGGAVRSPALDPELVHLKEKYGGAVSEAFRHALDALEGDDRTMLRMHYLDGLTIEEVGALFNMSRATAARVMSRARQRVVDGVRAALAEDLGVGRGEADSLLAFVRSRIDVSLRKHLG